MRRPHPSRPSRSQASVCSESSFAVSVLFSERPFAGERSFARAVLCSDRSFAASVPFGERSFAASSVCSEPISLDGHQVAWSALDTCDLVA